MADAFVKRVVRCREDVDKSIRSEVEDLEYIPAVSSECVPMSEALAGVS